MPKHLRRNVAIGAAALVAVGGGGVAIAASSSSTTSPADQQKAFLDDAAKRLNVTPDQLTDALKGAFGDQVDAAVTAGKLTQKQGDDLKARVAAGKLPLGGLGGFGGPGGPRRGGPGSPGRGFGGPAAGLSAAATYLGLTEAQLRDKLKDGKTSLADVAKAQNKDVAGLESAIVDAEKKQLDQAVTDGKLTASQRDDLEKDLAARVKDRVENAGPPKPKGGKAGTRGFGPGGPGGPGGGRGPGGPGYGGPPAP